MLVNDVVGDLRVAVQERLQNGRAAPYVVDEVLDEKLAEILFERRVPDDVAEAKLALISTRMLADKGLRESDLNTLSAIGGGDVVEGQFAEFGMESAEVFRQSFLERMRDGGLMQVRSYQGQDKYRLVNYAHLCAELEAFDQVKELLKANM